MIAGRHKRQFGKRSSSAEKGSPTLKKRPTLLQRLPWRRKRTPTLRRRIIGAFSVVVVLSICLTAGIAYLSTAFQFNDQRVETSQQIAQDVSIYLTDHFARTRSWEGIEPLQAIANLSSVAVADPPEFYGQIESVEVDLAALFDEEARLFSEIAQLEALRARVDMPQVEMGEVEANQDRLEDERSRLDDETSRIEDELSRLETRRSDLEDRRDQIETEIAERQDSYGIRGLNLRIEINNQPNLIQWISESGGLFSVDSVDIDAGESFSEDQKISYESEFGLLFPFPYLNASSVPVFDVATGEEVGSVTAQVSGAYFGWQQTQFFDDLLLSIVLGSVAVALISLLLGTWLAWRITAPVTALTRASRALANEGSTERLPVTSTDELGQMSASFNQMVDKLQTQRKLRKRLLSDVSHELNTPLSVIQLEAIGIQDGIQAPADAADQIIHEIGMLRNLVYDLSWLGETDLGEVRLNKTSQTIKRLLSSEVERWQTQARSQHVNLTLQSLPHLPLVDIDELRIGQALGNLMRNALEHSPAGSSVMISAETRPIHQAAGEWVVICVRDTGVGIDSAELQHIFERFYRTDEARNRQLGGRGLGLSIARQLAQLHGGHIWAESIVGTGSSFYIALPRAG